MHNKVKEYLSKVNKNATIIVLAVAAVALTAFLVLNPLNSSPDSVAKKAADYLNETILQGNQTATVVSASKDKALIKIEMSIGGNTYNMYATKDGRFLFPEAFDMGDVKTNGSAQKSNSNKVKSVADIVKSENPMLEAYIVSMCPFGLQAQRAMHNAIKNAPEMDNHMKVRYMGDIAPSGNTITAMHGDDEAQENLRQICIREEQKNKYWSYIGCYMKEGKNAECEKSEKIDSANLNACMKDPKRGVSYAKEDFDLSTKYGVSGSPTFILSGQEISEYDLGGRSPETLKTLICGGSIKEGSFCSLKLDTQEAATSFSLSYASSVNASTASANANCAPAK